MARPQFKKKCNVCKDVWVLAKHREYTICVECHLKQIFSEKITDKEYQFLDVDRATYTKSRFLRNIRHAYITYGSLTEKQIEAFKEAVKNVKAGKEEAIDEVWFQSK